MVIPTSMLDPKTPPDVIVRTQARKPVTDPALGIPVNVNKIGNPPNRLVTIGDSLTQGFQSGAIFKTHLSYPAMIARELGWHQLRIPTYGGPGDGLPLNLETLLRDLEKRFGSKIGFWEFLPTLFFLRQYFSTLEGYWERGQGSHTPMQQDIDHNLAVYGWDLRNTLSRTADICLNVLNQHPPQNDFFRLSVDHHNERAAVRVLNSARNQASVALTPLQAAKALSDEGTDTPGIETLIVLIGANNALGSVLTFKVNWSDTGYEDMEFNDRYTVWRPIHFQAELDRIVAEIKQIRAQHVILGTVGHVTIVPFARGVDKKVRPDSRYFPYYTLPWIQDQDFDPQKHPHLTENEVRAIDSAIDQYNDAITEAVRQARLEGRDWYVLETAGILDRLASRRYIEHPEARPDWWEEVGGEYPLPPELQGLIPVPDSKLFLSDSEGRTQGGIFSLDGIHPTTIGYGILAQEIIKIMQLAGVKFYESDGTERIGEIKVDFKRLIQEDTLISHPPALFSNVRDWIGGIDKYFNIFSRLLTSNY